MANFVAAFSEKTKEKVVLNENAIKIIRYENGAGFLAEGFDGEIYRIYNSDKGFYLDRFIEDFPDVSKFRECFIHI